MKFRKPLWISLALAAVLALALWCVHLWVVPLPYVKVSAFRAVPKYSVVLFSPPSFQSEKTPWAAWELAQSWELLGEIEAALSDPAHRKRALAVMQPTGQGRMGWMAIWEMRGSRELLQSWLAKNPGEASSFKNVWIYSGKTQEGAPFAIAQFRNLILAAPRPFMIEDAVRQLKTPGFSRMKASKKDGPLYLQPSQLSQQWSSALTERGRAVWDLFRYWPGWLNLAVETDSSGWKAQGHWAPGKDSSWLRLLAQALPAAPDSFFQILPEQTALFLWTATLPGAAAFPWHSGEWAAGQLPGFGGDTPSPLFWAGKIASPAALETWLQTRASEEGEIAYQTFEIHKIPADPRLPLPWSDTPLPMSACYAAQIENYFVFAGSRPALEVWLDQYIAGQTLGRMESFLEMRVQLPAEAAAWAYAQAEGLGKTIGKTFQPAQALPFLKKGDVQAAFMPEAERIRLEVLKKDRPDADSPVSIAWKANLDADAIIAPQFADGAWFAQDAKNQLYRIASGGRVEWKRPLSGRVLSDFFPIAYYERASKELLFNTPDAIYMIDRQGGLVSTFPLRLQSQATNGLLLTDFSGRGEDYGIFLACENGRLYGFDQFGRPLEGWSPGPEVGRVIHPMLHFQHQQKDYIAAFAQDGLLHVFQRDGSRRFPPVKVEGQVVSPPGFQVTPTGARIAIGNGQGQTVAVNELGASFSLQTPVGANDWVEFAFADVVGDERKDYILLSGRELAVYYYEGESFKLWKRLPLKNPQDELVAGLVAGEQKAFFGTVDAGRRQIFLWTPEGSLHPGFPLAGASAFSIARIPEGRLLVVALDGDVYAYVLNE
jgi:hypothetical protein